MIPKVHVLSNGIRLVYQHHPSPVSHCGILIGVGSRDESAGKEGLAHFIEHVLFKGTKNRKAYQVLNRLEVVGGELNAYTTKEETCIHASFTEEHLERAIDLIADILCNSIFPQNEIVKEIEVVLDEIHSYQDNPMEQIYDDFENLIFRNHPLGFPILGTELSVKSFTRNDILKFIHTNYHPGKMVFSYSGNVSFDKVVAVSEKYFGVLKKGGHLKKEKKDKLVKKVRSVVKKRSLSQAHYISGVTTYSLFNPKRFPLFLLNNILGGPGMNSRLNMNIREKHGYTYNIESSYIPYRDTGLFNIYLATEQKFLKKSLALVDKELEKFKAKEIPEKQLKTHKIQLKGQLFLTQENRTGVMLNNAKSVLNYGHPVNFDEVFRKIDAVTSKQILDVANELFDSGKISSLLFQPQAD